MDRDFHQFVLQYLSHNGVSFKTREIGEHVANAMEEHVEALIYNIVSLATTLAIVYDSKKVEPKHVVAIDQKYKSVCGGSTGQNGGSFPAQYFNPAAASTMAAGNFGGLNSQTIDFANNIARAGISVSDNTFIGGGATLASFRNATSSKVKKFVRAVLKLHNMSVSKHALHDLLMVIFHHMECLAKDIQKKPFINVPILQSILKMKRHAIFH